MKTRVILFIVLLLSASGWAKYSGGTGELNDPYRIATAEDLNSIGMHPEDFNDCFLMTADINMVNIIGTQFNIIGSYPSDPFTGVFDANGRTVFNFAYIEPNANYVGLFGYIKGPTAEIRNMVLVDPCVIGSDLVGSLVGYFYTSALSNCAVEGGFVSGDYDVGGLIGAKYYGIVSDCYSTASVEGNDCTGGLIGANNGWIFNCYAASEVVGNTKTGGLVGRAWFGGIQNSYSLGVVGGNDQVGGLVGDIWGDSQMFLSNCYTAGTISGATNVGGLVGTDGGGVLTNYTKCFYDSEVNHDVNGIGNSSDPNVIGLPTDQMQKRTVFADAGWDMVNVWDIGENQTYPFLRTHPPSDINKDDETNLFDLAIIADNWLTED